MKRKGLKVFAITSMMLIAGCMQSFAASSRIGSVTIGFTEEHAEEGELREATPSIRGGHCEITDWECSHDFGDWSPGHKVTFTIEIEPTDNYHFSKSDTVVKTTGKNTELANVKVVTSKITAKVNYWPSLKLGAPENLYWDDSSEWLAVWDKVEYCGKYEVKIITSTDEDKTKTKIVTVNKPEIDVSSYATEGEVMLSVRAIPKNDNQEKYYTPSEWVNMDDITTPSYENTSLGQFQGAENNRTFVKSDGSLAIGWQYLNNVWYFFDPANNNVMSTSKWIQVDNEWYYFNQDGHMEVGWCKVNDYWYYLNANNKNIKEGAMIKGWIKTGPNGPWYYLNDGSVQGIPYGACLVNTITPDGYIVDENGAWYPEK